METIGSGVFYDAIQERCPLSCLQRLLLLLLLLRFFAAPASGFVRALPRSAADMAKKEKDDDRSKTDSWDH
jgi:hypothetical protein